MKTIAAVPTRRSSRISARPKIDNSRSKRLQIRNVLVPTDFSAASREAIEFALPFLKSFNAELHLAHVVPQDYPLSSLADLPLLMPELEIGRRVRQRLKDAAASYAVTLRRENIHSLRGRPFEQICQLARDLNIDVIITSTRGTTGLKHLVLGSTAERILRYSPCPVLVIRPRDNKSGNGKFPRRQLRFSKILVPIDFSKCSSKGLNYATALAKRFGSKLVLLNSVAIQYYFTNDEYTRYDFPRLLQYAEKDARKRMRELVRKTGRDGVTAESSVEVGHAGQQICARAEEFGADLIVTSTHGRTGFKHVLLGSTAEYVVRHAPCPVLVVPSHERPALTTTATKL